MQWSAIVAAIGFAQRHLNRDHPTRRLLTDAVFPVYIVHQSLIILLAMALAAARWPLGAEAVVLVAGTFTLSWLCFEAVRRVPWLRPWFGLARRDAAMALARLPSTREASAR
jgi:surface polysaccharide O-acyltransferase-like enzyme